MRKIVLLVIGALLLSVLAPNAYVTSGSITSKATTYRESDTFDLYGPRMDTLNLKYYSDSAALYNALKNGEVDLTDAQLNPTQMQDAFNDSNLQTAVSPADSMYEFDFNNNATTPTYPNWTNPTAYEGFRQGIAYLVDKDYYASQYYPNSYYTRIDTPIPRPLGDWWVDWSASQYDSYGNFLGNYPYEKSISEHLNLTLAAQCFDQAGFVQGDTMNPYHNSDWPGSAQYLRVYPESHPKHGQDLDPLIFVIRAAFPRSLYGDDLAGLLNASGIPINEMVLSPSAARIQVMQNRDYHIYTGGWVGSAVGTETWLEPDTDPSFPAFLDCYSSNYIGASYPNYPQFRNATYDELCQEADSSSNLTQARNAALECQEILIQEAACVWLYSTSQVTAYRDLAGVTNLMGGRIDNQWTFLRAAHSWGGNSSSTTINYGLASTPPSLNVITDYDDAVTCDCLGLIYDTLLSTCPYDKTPGTVMGEADRGGTMPWLAKDWNLEDWPSPYNPGSTLTKLTFILRDGVKWHDGIGLNSTDVKFTIEYLQSLGDITGLYSCVSDVHHVTTPDAHTVIVYENVSNIRTLDDIGKLPILPKHIFQSIGLNVTGYTPGADAGYAANQTLIGCGPWKYVSYNSTTLCLQANRDYFMKTPPDAEVDFRYDWKLGCWAVDAMDATMVGEANGTLAHREGATGPSPTWQPGCDINGDGTIDNNDLNEVSTEFNETWGASATRTVAEPPDCAVYVELAQNPVLLGQNLTAYLKLRNLDSLSGFQVKLSYDNTMLNCLNLSLSPIYLSDNTLPMKTVVDQANGLIWICNTSLACAQQVSGNVTLATITFNTTQAGSSIPHLWDTELARLGEPESTCQPMPHQEIDAEVTIGVQTPVGTNVTVLPANNTRVTFPNVTSQGLTTLNTTSPPSAQFVSAVYDEIHTNATYTGNITLQLGYDATGLSLQDQLAMKIWLWNESSSCYVDITTSVNTTSHTVYGVSPHLSMFTVTGDLGITDDLNVPGTTTINIPDNPPALPAGLSGLDYYEINTTKNVPKPIGLSLAYNCQNIPPGEENLTRMLFWNDSSNSWVDVTTSIDTTSHIIYGAPPHLSMFTVTSFVQPPDGINVVGASCLKTVVCQGYCANVSFTICNQGYSTQTSFSVSLYWNTTLLKTYQTNQLGPGEQEVFNFMWNTTGQARGTYCLSACSHLIGWIIVSKVGDITGAPDGGPDGTVDMKDIRMVAKSFGANLVTNPNSPKYGQYWHSTPSKVDPCSPNCDINNDGTIDMKDVRIAAKNFGK
jgi:ABC-type transport system substrate-binding protein